MKKDKIASYIVNAVAIAALFILGQYMTTSGMLSRYYTGIVMMVGINIILTASLNLTTGYLGQLALGHAGFMPVAHTARRCSRCIRVCRPASPFPSHCS